jgi:hypothetical protein
MTSGTGAVPVLLSCGASRALCHGAREYLHQ